MSYQKPICDCDSELFILENVMNSNSHKISSKGRVLKKPFDKALETWSSELFCINCGNKYEYKTDDKNRCIRGELKQD